MYKKLFLLPILLVSLSVQNAQAFFNWGVAFGDGPCCHYYEPAPTLNLGFAAPLGDGGPAIGFNVGLPLGEPRRVVCHRPVVCHPAPVVCHSAPVVCHTVHTVRHEPLVDDRDCTFWEIYNDTDMPIRVISSTESKIIRPGDSRKLSHSRTYKLSIRVGSQKVTVNCKNHYVTVTTDAGGNIKIIED